MTPLRRSGSLVLVAMAALALVVGGCSDDEPARSADSPATTAATESAPTTATGVAPDPCAIADPSAVGSLLGSDPGTPISSSEMSADGAGLVLNCTFVSDDEAKDVTYTQRLGMGRDTFEASRGATADAVPVGDDGYWIPSKTRLLVMDGDDLVAILFAGVDVDLPTATSMMDAALARRP